MTVIVIIMTIIIIIIVIIIVVVTIIITKIIIIIPVELLRLVLNDVAFTQDFSALIISPMNLNFY
jgi:hypothetical protein